MTKRNKIIQNIFALYYPNARCTLNFANPFQCLVATCLSAQTNDKAVNLLTPSLFSKYKDAYELSKADYEDVKNCIKRLGLYKNKANNLIKLSQEIVSRFDGKVPSSLKDLISLPGVGIKTASVVLAESFNIPSFPIDTHCSRVLIRLGIAKEGDSIETIMDKAKKSFSKDRWISLHHQIIQHGRTICLARKAKCEECPFKELCTFKANVL